MLGRPISSWVVAGFAIFTLVAARQTIVQAATLGDNASLALVTAIVISAVLALVPSKWAAVAVLGWVAIDCGMSLVWMNGSSAYRVGLFAGIVFRAGVLVACAYHIWQSLSASERR